VPRALDQELSLRLHELAKDLEANSKDLLRIAKEMGLPVRSHSSNLAPGEVALLKAAYRFGELDEEKLLARIESLEEEKHKKAEEDKKAWLQKQSDKHHEEVAEKARAAAALEEAPVAGPGDEVEAEQELDIAPGDEAALGDEVAEAEAEVQPEAYEAPTAASAQHPAASAGLGQPPAP